MKGVDDVTKVEALRRKIQESGYRFDYIAERLGISRQALYNKMNNRTEFLGSEIAILRKLLNLSEDEVIDIFLTAG